MNGSRICLVLLIVCLYNLSFANFGGYYRYSTEGGGAILNSSNNQMIELLKEDILIHLDQRVDFTATFQLKNTSNIIQELTLAFPQFSYWYVPFVSEKGYTPADYYPLNEALIINNKLTSFDEELFSDKFSNTDQIELKDKSSFSKLLIQFAETTEAESPPSMPFVIWKLKKVSFLPNEVKTVSISFTRPWFFEEEVWSFGHRSSGERNFEYIFETANTWKNSKIGNFNMTITFPEDAWENLNLNDKWFEITANNTVRVKKTNWTPSASDNLNIVWKSNFSLNVIDECWDVLYNADYSWRFGSDGSTETSWCFKPSDMNCEEIEISFINRNIQSKAKDERGTLKKFVVINGFAKTQALAAQNAKPKNIQLVYTDIHGEKHFQNILLSNQTAKQSFNLIKESALSQNFYFSVLDYYPGTKYDDICIAEMWLE